VQQLISACLRRKKVLLPQPQGKRVRWRVQRTGSAACGVRARRGGAQRRSSAWQHDANALPLERAAAGASSSAAPSIHPSACASSARDSLLQEAEDRALADAAPARRAPPRREARARRAVAHR
jgi:hypothetical protein